jgi:hypothetical protein
MNANDRLLPSPRVKAFGGGRDSGSGFLLLKCTILGVLLLATVSAGGADQKKQRAHLIFSATVRKIPISIFIADRPFDPSKHRTTPHRIAGTEQEPEMKSATIDGREVIGTDQTLPTEGERQLSEVYVKFGDKRVDVPESLLTHVFLPQLKPATFDQHYADTLVSVSADGKAVLISLHVGDGGGTTTYAIYVGMDGTCTNEEPERPQP